VPRNPSRPPVARVPRRALRVEPGQLRAQDRGPQMVHPARDVGRVVFDCLEHLRRRDCAMALIKHVGLPDRIDRARHHLRIVRRHEKAALAGIHMLVGLGGIAPDQPVPPRGHPAPARAHRVRAILDHGHAMGAGRSRSAGPYRRCPRIWLSREQRARRFARPFRPDRRGRWSAPRSRPRTWALRPQPRWPGYRGEREGVGQHLITRLHPQGAQRSESA
jgi:hypothetical protein